MVRLAASRLMMAIPTMFVIITLAFFMMRFAPGGPFDLEANLSAIARANLEAKYQLDQPLLVQYLSYLQGLMVGDFGPSYVRPGISVGEYLATGLPVSLQLGFTAILLGVIVGIPCGAYAALRQNSATDYTIMGVAMVGVAIPKFVIAPILALVFGLYLDLLPVGGWGNGALRNKVLPIVALALPFIAYVARLTRASMIEVLRSDFVRTARAKGLPMRAILFRHCLKPTLIPVVGYLGPGTASVITGSIVVEQIFGIPGMGSYFVEGALNRDYTLVLGAVIVYATLLILMNAVVDIAYAFLDPRVGRGSDA
jgi:oligopeptide transport system permease protein